MPYFHAQIEIDEKHPNSTINKTFYDFDRDSLSEIEEDIIQPYLQGLLIHIDGYFVDPTKVLRIKVISSVSTAGEFANLQDRSRPTSSFRTGRGELFHHSYSEYSIDVTKLAFKNGSKKVSLTTRKPQSPAGPAKKLDGVFIVHGHDILAKTETARFVENMGLRSIILHEQVSKGKTIIEKIEEFSNVGFGIVLYTPCDIGAARGSEQLLRPRARQNVILEHGYLLAKLGRANVCALVKDNTIELPNDMSGIVYIQMDENQAWHLKIAKELKNAGFDIDLNKL